MKLESFSIFGFVSFFGNSLKIGGRWSFSEFTSVFGEPKYVGIW